LGNPVQEHVINPLNSVMANQVGPAIDSASIFAGKQLIGAAAGAACGAATDSATIAAICRQAVKELYGSKDAY